MKRHATLWAGFVAVLFGVIFYANIPSTLFMIFVIGIIPGTSITIPAWVMLLMYPSVFFGMLYWLSRQTLLIGERTPIKQSRKRAAKTTRSVAQKSRRRKTTLVAKRRTRVAV